MVAISLYRGNLHRVSDVPRRWPMPPHGLTLGHFKRLTHRRSLALSRLLPPPPPPPPLPEPVQKSSEEGMGDSGCPKPPEPTSPAHPDKTTDDGAQLAEPPAASGESDASELGGEQTFDAKKEEISEKLDMANDSEEKKKELEQKLHILNEKKHHLVQMLKQILNAEEEVKKRSMQQSGVRASVSVQGETTVDMGSVTRPVPKLSVDMSFCNDLNGESEDAANHNSHGPHLHPTHSTSPSAISTLNRTISGPFQHNSILHTTRGSLFGAAHGQTSSNMLSPSRFAPSMHQGHSTSLPPGFVPGGQFVASSPSPAASGGASSVFRDSHQPSPSWN